MFLTAIIVFAAMSGSALAQKRCDALLPGVKINTGVTGFAPIEWLRTMLFRDERRELFGVIISAEPSRQIMIRPD